MLWKMKRGLSILLALMFVIGGLTACSGGTPSSGSNAGSDAGGASNASDVKIGILLGTSAQERWQKEIAMFEEYAAELGINIIIQTAEDDQSKQLNQCENLLSQGIDVLLCQPVDSQGAGAIVDICHEEGIKVLAYDRFIENSDLDYCVGFDDVQVGEFQASMVLEGCGYSGNIAILKGDSAVVNTHNLYIGNMNILQPYIDDGSITVVCDQYCTNWGAEDAMSHLENALSSYNNEIAGVVCQNDTTATGACQALEAQNLAGLVPVSGQDCDLSAVQRVVGGTQIGDVYKPLKIMNTVALDIAVLIAQGGDPETEFSSDNGSWSIYNNGTVDVPAMLMDVIRVDAENVASILVGDNFYTMEEIYANVPESEWPEV